MLDNLMPDIDDLRDAKSMSYVGAISAFIIAIVLIIWARLVIEAGLFIYAGFCLLRKSRVASTLIAINGVYNLFKLATKIKFTAVEIVDIVPAIWRMGFQIMIPFILTMVFINTTRAAFAYHKLKLPDQTSLFVKIIKGVLIHITAIILISFLTASLMKYDLSRRQKVDSKVRYILQQIKKVVVRKGGYAQTNGIIEKAGQKNIEKPVTADTAKDIDKEIRIFRLKSGETIKGKVIAEDSDFYTIETTNSRQIPVIKDDILNFDG